MKLYAKIKQKKTSLNKVYTDSMIFLLLQLNKSAVVIGTSSKYGSKNTSNEPTMLLCKQASWQRLPSCELQ